MTGLGAIMYHPCFRAVSHNFSLCIIFLSSTAAEDQFLPIDVMQYPLGMMCGSGLRSFGLF